MSDSGFDQLHIAHRLDVFAPTDSPDPVVAYFTPFAADIARLVAGADGWAATQRLAEQKAEP